MVQAGFGLSVTAENWVRFLDRKYQICFEQSGTEKSFCPSNSVSLQYHSTSDQYSSSYYYSSNQKDERTKPGKFQIKQCSSVFEGALDKKVLSRISLQMEKICVKEQKLC